MASALLTNWIVRCSHQLQEIVLACLFGGMHIHIVHATLAARSYARLLAVTLSAGVLGSFLSSMRHVSSLLTRF